MKSNREKELETSRREELVKSKGGLDLVTCRREELVKRKERKDWSLVEDKS